MLRAQTRAARTAMVAVTVLGSLALGACQSESGCAGRTTPEETLAGFLRAAVGNDAPRARGYADVTYVLEDETVSGLSQALSQALSGVSVDALELTAEQHGELFYFAVADGEGTPVGTFSVRRSDRCHGVLWADVSSRTTTVTRPR
ncbi:hypothetical protein [Flavimobilis marinus]|nr:hypothetical protein [Flavimobilis marinus]